MPTENTENTNFTFTGTINDFGKEEPKKEIHIHIENIETLNINF